MMACVNPWRVGTRRHSLLALSAATLVAVSTAHAQRTAAVMPNATDSRKAEQLLSRPVTIDLDRVTRVDAVEAVAAAAKVVVQYRVGLFDAYRGPVTLHAKELALRSALERILEGTSLGVIVDGNGRIGIVDTRAEGDTVPRATGVISGDVVDSATGKGVPQVRVTIAGTRRDATTDAAGRFTLAGVPQGTYTVITRAISFRSASRTVEVTPGETIRIRFILTPSATVLSGVVTTATGVQQRQQIGNDITVLNADSIRRVAPITSVTDLLENRVPGLVVSRTTGIPGAPSRLRLRGISSPTRSNDPIVIVDGIRVYADQSSGGDSISPRGAGTKTYAGPSPLDQIDPNSIETIEVFKGPSASALYGSDAGNGVIVITTKRGQPGKTRWSLTADQGRSSLPGDWPMNYFQFGHYPSANINGSESRLCGFGDGCVHDSVVVFQALTNPQTAVFGHGSTSMGSLTVSGGSATLGYAVTGSASDQLGILRLPGIEATRFEKLHQFAAPDWMRRPDRYRTWNASSHIDIQLGGGAGHLGLSNSVFSSAQQQSSLQTAISQLQSTYIDLSQLGDQPLLNQFYNRARLNTTTFTNSAMLAYPVRTWLPLTATLGLNNGIHNDNTVTPRNYQLGTPDSVGFYSVSRGTSQVQTLNVGTSFEIPGNGRMPGAHFPLGLNMTRQSTTSLAAAMTDLPLGVTEPTAFPTGPGSIPTTQSDVSSTTYGWYAAPTFDLGSRLFFSPGIRFDGGTASGRNAGFTPFPKVDLSWIAIERQGNEVSPFQVTLLRPRVAFGVAGVQPAPGDQLRLLQVGILTPIGGGASTDIALPATLGNTKLRPERSREFEGGLDAEWLNRRVTVALTAYQKMRYDAILSLRLAPSVYTPMFNGGGDALATIPINIGSVRNTGADATVGLQILNGRQLGWSINGNVHTNKNRVVSLAPGFNGILDFQDNSSFATQVRVVPGYPLFGRWARPVLSYADPDHDGIILSRDIRVADSAVYIGAQEPKYQASFGTSVSLFEGRVTFATNVAYENGLTQFSTDGYGTGSGGAFGGISPSDPGVPLSQQAWYVGAISGETPYGLAQRVNTLRWSSLSVAYQVPASIVRRLRASSLSVSLQGSNLGLHTNYRGIDPNVNANAFGNAVSSTGQLPQPRVWQLHFTLGN